MWVNRWGPSPQMSDVSKLLRLLTKNEWPWVICSGRSKEMSDRERIAQVAHQKWANEWIAHFFERIAHLLIFGQKSSDSLGKPMSEFPALIPGDKIDLSTLPYLFPILYYIIKDIPGDKIDLSTLTYWFSSLWWSLNLICPPDPSPSPAPNFQYKPLKMPQSSSWYKIEWKRNFVKLR